MQKMFNQPMKTTKAIRLDNVRRIIKVMFDGNQAEFSRAIKRDPGQVNQFAGKNPIKGIGDALAKHIEKHCGLESGSLDHAGSVLADDGVTAPYVSVRAGMGRGYLIPDYQEVIDNISLSSDWIRQNLIITRPQNLALITGFGDSMAPTYSDGDVLIVDRGVNEIKMDAVFVLARGDELFVKRLQRKLNGSIRVISDNKDYEDYEINNSDLEDIRIEGRVLCAWACKKL